MHMPTWIYVRLAPRVCCISLEALATLAFALPFASAAGILHIYWLIEDEA